MSMMFQAGSLWMSEELTEQGFDENHTMMLSTLLHGFRKQTQSVDHTCAVRTHDHTEASANNIATMAYLGEDD